MDSGPSSEAPAAQHLFGQPSPHASTKRVRQTKNPHSALQTLSYTQSALALPIMQTSTTSHRGTTCITTPQKATTTPPAGAPSMAAPYSTPSPPTNNSHSAVIPTAECSKLGTLSYVRDPGCL